jgi:S1-C subfamily serine protease
VSPVSSTQAVGAPHDADPTDLPVRRRRGSVRSWAAVVLLALTAVALWRFNDRGPAPLTSADVDRAVQRGLDQSKREQAATPPDGAVAFTTIGPSLVTVTTDRSPAGTAAASDKGLGSGVVINARGAVLTALHVVEGARQIHVRFADGTQATARVASTRPDSDIAVLQPDRLPEIVVPAVMAGAPQVGDDVFAVGNPLGLEASLTAGVVSAHDRSVRTDANRSLDNLIQFDAAVNPGNSGGPLLNRGGQVVGIVTGLANPSKQDYFIGIGFAVPIATAGGAAGGPQQ